MNHISFFFLAVSLLLFCDQSQEKMTGEDYDFPYSLNAPTATFTLPKKLKEISGLGYDEKNDEFVAIQDESGIIFFISPKTGKVSHEINFWKEGDFEGVEIIDEAIYVVKSSGTIYKVVASSGDGDPLVEKFNFFLNEKNDIEGLAYDKRKNSLLIACKADSGREGEYKDSKAIYGFDLSTHQLFSEPVYLISNVQIRNFIKDHVHSSKLDKLSFVFEDDFSFAPSGIAVHPNTANIYILSSASKLLVVINQEGKIIHLEKLKKDIFPQPEGICFDREENLYVSNEGKSGDGEILKFPPKQ